MFLLLVASLPRDGSGFSGMLALTVYGGPERLGGHNRWPLPGTIQHISNDAAQPITAGGGGDLGCSQR